MSENFEVLAWRAGQVDKDGEVFTTEALTQMADGLRPGSDITLSFDFQRVIGHVVQAWIEDDALYIGATFDDPVFVEALRSGSMSIRPGFSIEEQHMEDGHRVIDKVGITHVALTPNPMPLPGEQTEKQEEQFDDGCVGEHKAGTCSTWEA